jgi:hypothetical protein
MKVIKIQIILLILFSFNVKAQINKIELLGSWVSVSEKLYELDEESITMDGSPIEASMSIVFKTNTMLDIIENGVRYDDLNFTLKKKKDNQNYLLFGNREYLIKKYTKDSLVLIKKNTVLPLKILFKKRVKL